MELVGVFAVAQEEHVCHQRHQCFCHILAIGVGIFEGGFYFALRIEFGFEAPHIVVGMNQIFFFDFFSTSTEGALEHPVGDEGFEEVVLEMQSVTFNFFAGHTQCGRELTEQAIHGIDGNFPNAEEAEHVVDAVGVEVFCHFAEAFHPPGAAVGYHFIPVVGGEAPVLTVGGEGIGRCTRLAVEVEVAGFHPCFHTVATDADGDIAFEDNAFLARIFVGGAHLLVEVELHEIPECHFLVFAGATVGHGFAFAFVETVVVGPLAEGGGAVEVAIVAECGVGHEPVFIGIEEGFECFAFQNFGTFLLKHLTQIASLGGIHAFVIDLRQGVEFALQGGVIVHALFICQCRKLAQVGVLRMQGVDADAIVGIRILPGVGDGGVVDGEHLQGTLTGGCHPVDHLFQVAEIAHAKATLAAKREDGHHGACHTPRRNGKARFFQFIYHGVAFLQLGEHDGAIAGFFPKHILGIAGFHCHKLEFKHTRLQTAGVERCHPFVVSMFHHGSGFVHCPIAHSGAGAHHCQHLIGCQLRSAHLQHHGIVVGGGGHHKQLTASTTLGECCAVQITVGGIVDPAVVGG